jgi:hypothetical protein
LLTNKYVNFVITLPYVWTIVFILLVIMSYISSDISSIIAAERLIPLTFILSPFIYFAGAVISFIYIRKSGINKNILTAFIFNIVLLILWFFFKNPFYIELNFIS